jgi:tRNA-dihydrouridine synthase
MKPIPWPAGQQPLMLAPMQGLTNAALRACLLERGRPDLVFTEFVRAHSQSRRRVAKSDLADISAHQGSVPLVVQLIGTSAEVLGDAARQLQQAGCRRLNLNLGCPFGRMTSGASGGELLRQPGQLAGLLLRLRQDISGDFSVKCRAGFDDPRQIFDLLPVFEDCGVDWLILHPRTVIQKYAGQADHRLTAEVAGRTRLPLIANGDINDAETGRRLLAESGAAGLMLGRGALADPLLFQRIRGLAPGAVDEPQRRKELAEYIGTLVPLYREKFCGERQALDKLKDVLSFIGDENLQRELKKLRRATSEAVFMAHLAGLASV